MVVPGSAQVKAQAEREGLDEVFQAAGAEWREAGCSMCIAMNGDQGAPGQYIVSHQQPQLRGTPGQGLPHLPRLAADRRCHRAGGRRQRPADRSSAADAPEPGAARAARWPSRSRTFSSRLIPLPAENVDTDQIIPARFLKTTEKSGLADALFNDWRYVPDGIAEPDFVLNKPEMQGAPGARWSATTSAAARPASTHPGRSPRGASRPSSARPTRTSSTTTP